MANSFVNRSRSARAFVPREYSPQCFAWYFAGCESDESKDKSRVEMSRQRTFLMAVDCGKMSVTSLSPLTRRFMFQVSKQRRATWSMRTSPAEASHDHPVISMNNCEPAETFTGSTRGARPRRPCLVDKRTLSLSQLDLFHLSPVTHCDIHLSRSPIKYGNHLAYGHTSTALERASTRSIVRQDL